MSSTIKFETAIKYYIGHRYQLAQDYEHDLTGTQFELDLTRRPLYQPIAVHMTATTLRVEAGYNWDGPSGPTIHTSNTFRASLVHDALYHLMRLQLIPNHSRNRKQADLLMYRILRADGMNFVRAKVFYYAVRLFGKASTSTPVRTYSAP